LLAGLAGMNVNFKPEVFGDSALFWLVAASVIAIATLVRNVLRAAGVPPAPRRGRPDWRSFLRQHAATTLACDLFTVGQF
jgi:hypothetical protein